MSSRQATSGVNRRGQAAPKPVKVHRYRAGQLPKGVSLAEEEESTTEEEEEGEEEEEEEGSSATFGKRGRFAARFGQIQARPGLGDEETPMEVSESRRGTLAKPSDRDEPSSRSSTDTGDSTVPLDQVTDPRLRRILQAQRVQGISKGASGRQGAGRRGHGDGESEEDEEENKAMLARRERLRQGALDRRRREEEQMNHTSLSPPTVQSSPLLSHDRHMERGHRVIHEELSMTPTYKAPSLTKSKVVEEMKEEEDEEEESEEEKEEESTSEEEEEEYHRPIFKPIFKSKSKRLLNNKEQLKESTEGNEDTGAEDSKAEERYRESQRIITETIRQSQTVNVDITDMDQVDDTDGVDEEGEFQAWRLRELKRLMKDREEREAAEEERAEIERRRNLTEEERAKEDAERAREEDSSESKGKERVFGQRYYHKGAFYQDVDKELLSRDYQKPTEDEPKNRESLPEPLQSKKMGFAGQTKWTHLAAEDTTQKDAAWYVKSTGNKRAVGKMGGMKQEFDRPTRKRQRP